MMKKKQGEIRRKKKNLIKLLWRSINKIKKKKRRTNTPAATNI